MNWPAELLMITGLLCLVVAVTLWNPLVGLGFTGLVLLAVSFLMAFFGGASSDGDDTTG